MNNKKYLKRTKTLKKKTFKIWCLAYGMTEEMRHWIALEVNEWVCMCVCVLIKLWMNNIFLLIYCIVTIVFRVCIFSIAKECKNERENRGTEVQTTKIVMYDNFSSSFIMSFVIDKYDKNAPLKWLNRIVFNLMMCIELNFISAVFFLLFFQIIV